MYFYEHIVLVVWTVQPLNSTQNCWFKVKCCFSSAVLLVISEIYLDQNYNNSVICEPASAPKSFKTIISLYYNIGLVFIDLAFSQIKLSTIKLRLVSLPFRQDYCEKTAELQSSVMISHKRSALSCRRGMRVGTFTTCGWILV